MVFGVKNVFTSGSGSYPNGAEAFLAGIAPPPGFYFENYASNYHVNALKENARNDVGVFNKLNVDAAVLRFVWISRFKILGGIYGQHFLFLFCMST